jgi:hypothetical protein
MSEGNGIKGPGIQRDRHFFPASFLSQALSQCAQRTVDYQ